MAGHKWRIRVLASISQPGVKTIMIFGEYWPVFLQLIREPFQHTESIWGIVPLYFSWVLNELTSSKASYTTAINTGFSFIWAATHWAYQYSLLFEPKNQNPIQLLLALNAVVTLLVFGIGCIALVSGIRRKYPRFCGFLGHSRFSCYFMIAIFPIQSNYLHWTWDRLIAIGIFGIPLWFLLHFGLMPVRR
jgi:hypothetical protein